MTDIKEEVFVEELGAGDGEEDDDEDFCLLDDPCDDVNEEQPGCPRVDVLGEEGPAAGGVAPLYLDKLPRPVDELNCRMARHYLVKLLRAANGGHKPSYGQPEKRPPFWPEHYCPWGRLTDVHSRPADMPGEFQYSEMLKLAIVRGYKYYGYDPNTYIDRNVDLSEKRPIHTSSLTSCKDRATPPPRLPRPVSKLNCVQSRTSLSKLLRYQQMGNKPMYGSPETHPPWWPDECIRWCDMVDLRGKPPYLPDLKSFTDVLKIAISKALEYYGKNPETYYSDEDDDIGIQPKVIGFEEMRSNARKVPELFPVSSALTVPTTSSSLPLPPKLPCPVSRMSCGQIRIALSQILMFHNGGRAPRYMDPAAKPEWWPDHLIDWCRLKNLRHRYEGPLGNTYTNCLRAALVAAYAFYDVDSSKYVDSNVNNEGEADNAVPMKGSLREHINQVAPARARRPPPPLVPLVSVQEHPSGPPNAVFVQPRSMTTTETNPSGLPRYLSVRLQKSTSQGATTAVPGPIVASSIQGPFARLGDTAIALNIPAIPPAVVHPQPGPKPLESDILVAATSHDPPSGSDKDGKRALTDASAPEEEEPGGHSSVTLPGVLFKTLYPKEKLDDPEWFPPKLSVPKASVFSSKQELQSLKRCKVVVNRDVVSKYVSVDCDSVTLINNDCDKQKNVVMELFARDLVQKKHTDTKLKAGGDGEVVEVHKAILAAHSAKMKSILSGTEENECLIIMEDLEGTVLRLLVQALYTGRVTVQKENINDFMKGLKVFKSFGMLRNLFCHTSQREDDDEPKQAMMAETFLEVKVEVLASDEDAEDFDADHVPNACEKTLMAETPEQSPGLKKGSGGSKDDFVPFPSDVHTCKSRNADSEILRLPGKRKQCLRLSKVRKGKQQRHSKCVLVKERKKEQGATDWSESRNDQDVTKLDEEDDDDDVPTSIQSQSAGEKETATEPAPSVITSKQTSTTATVVVRGLRKRKNADRKILEGGTKARKDSGGDR